LFIEAPGLTLLVLIFLIFGYFYLFYPVFIVLAICLCLPVLIIAAFYFGGRGQEPANNVEFYSLIKFYIFYLFRKLLKNYQELNFSKRITRRTIAIVSFAKLIFKKMRKSLNYLAPTLIIYSIMNVWHVG